VSVCITINENNGLVDAELVVELRVNESFVDVRPKVCALIPADVQVIDVHMTQILHHFQLITHCKLKTKTSLHSIHEIQTFTNVG